MNRSGSILLATIFSMGACARQADLESEERAVESVIGQFTQVLETEDIELFAQIVAHDPEIVAFNMADRIVGYEANREGIEASFAIFKDARFSVRDRVLRVHGSGLVAWFSQLLDISGTVGGQAVSFIGARMTGVLEKRNDGWVIVQFHTSVPEVDSPSSTEPELGSRPNFGLERTTRR